MINSSHSETMHLVIEGPPIPLARPRMRSTRFGPRVYDSQKQEKSWVQWKMIEQRGKRTEMPKVAFFSVSMRFYMPVPQSLSVGQKNRLLWGFSEHNTKPDLSNLVKFYEDCMNGIILSDDSMIARISAKKLYSSHPRTEIEIMSCEEKEIDNEAAKILLFFSPTEMCEFISHVLTLKNLLPQKENDVNDVLENLTGVGAVLSEIAHKYSKKFQKIEKSHGTFWKKLDI